MDEQNKTFKRQFYNDAVNAHKPIRTQHICFCEGRIMASYGTVFLNPLWSSWKDDS